MQYCGECEACRTYHFNQCSNLLEPGSTIPGAIAEYIKVHEKYVWGINDIIAAYGEEKGFEIGSLVEPTGISYNGTIVKSGGHTPRAVRRGIRRGTHRFRMHSAYAHRGNVQDIRF